MQEQTLANIVENFHRRGLETAYVCRRGYRIRRWSYGQTADFSFRLAEELQKRKVETGDRIILWGEDCPEWVVSFFACGLCGAVVVPMDRTAPLEFVQRVCRQVEPRLCICSREQPHINPLLPFITFESLSDLQTGRHNAQRSLPDLKSENAVEIVFTSGTTADPKGVVLTHKNILGKQTLPP